MKKILIIVLLALTTSLAELSAQKLVIGSKVEGVSELSSLEWVGNAPQNGKTWIVDFFSSSNPSAMKFYEEHLPRVYGFASEKTEIVIVTTKADDKFFELAQKDGDKYHFVVDNGAALFKLMQVKFIPFTVVIDKNGEILWQGNLADLDKKAIK